MSPIEQPPHPLEVPIEALIIQNKEQWDETNALLEAIVAQWEKNNPEPLLEANILQSKKNTEELKEAVLESNKNSLKIELDGVELAQIKWEDGKDWKDWKDWEKWKDGKDGKDGKDWIDWINGLNGIDWINGIDGKDGKDGKDWEDWIDGKDWKDGNDWSPDTPEQIKSKLEKLKGDKRLDIKSIKGIDKIEESIKKAGQFTQTHQEYDINWIQVANGTRLNLKAGTNVTLSWSQSSNGADITINATGGSGWAVDSVNWETWTVVLDADDISDTSTTKKFTTTTEKNTWNWKQNALTADVDYLTPSTAWTTYEPKKWTDDNYVTDAEKIVIGNTSGTNSGDNATNSQYSWLATSKQDTLISGTNIKTINSTSLLGSGNIDISWWSGNGAIMSRWYWNNASFSEWTIFADLQSLSTSSDEAWDIIPFSWTIKNLFISILWNAHSSTSSYTLAINWTATTVTVSYSSEETWNKSDTTHTDSVSAWDRVTVKAIGDWAGDIYFSFSYSVI